MALLPVLQANSLSIGLPYTDGYATMNNGIGTINLYPTLLAQHDIAVYRDAGDMVVSPDDTGSLRCVQTVDRLLCAV